jgi:hypothetical protein
MALTKIQPSGLDQTQDYSVHKLTISGVDVLGYAQSAFSQANTVYDYANTLSPTDTFARTQANSAYIQANAAFDKANTGGPSFGTIAVSGGVNANIVAATSNTLITFVPSFGVTMNLNSTNQTISVGILGGVQGTSIDWGSITDSTITTSLDFGSTV